MENSKSGYKKKKCLFISCNLKNYKSTAVDTLHFFNLGGQSEYFNYLHFKKIIKYLSKTKKNLKIIKSNNYNKSNEILENEKKLKIDQKSISGLASSDTFLKSFLKFLEKIFYQTAKKNKIIIVDSFEKKSLFLINLFLKQIPHSFAHIFDWGNRRRSLINSSINLNKRHKIIYSRVKKKNFEGYLSETISEDIPICFLEKFNFVKQIVKKISIKPNLIISGFKHYHDEIFKFWVAECKYKFKTKFIIMAHGKAHQKISGIFNFEENISDKKLIWSKKNLIKNLSFPKNILSLNGDIKKRGNVILSYVHYNATPYPVRIQTGPTGENNVQIDKNFKVLYENLDINIKKKFKFLPNDNFSKLQESKVKKIIDSKKIAKKLSLNEHLPKSKLVICSYPQSALIDSILSGPTILLCDYSMWEPISEFSNIYVKMKKAGIFFDDPLKAAKHVNKHWENIELWWSSRKIVKLKEEFLKTNNFSQKKTSFEKLKKWIDFFNSEKDFKKA